MSTMRQAPAFDIAGFRDALDRCRKARRATWKDIAAATGVSQATLSRMAGGRRPDAASLAALSAWAGIDPRRYSDAPAPRGLRAEPLASVEINKRMREVARLLRVALDALEALADVPPDARNKRREP